MDTSIDLDPPRNYTPSSWDPLMVNSALSFGSARCGITEQSKLAQSFLCNLNNKRYSLFLPQLKWHYGLGKYLNIFLRFYQFCNSALACAIFSHFLLSTTVFNHREG